MLYCGVIDGRSTMRAAVTSQRTFWRVISFNIRAWSRLADKASYLDQQFILSILISSHQLLQIEWETRHVIIFSGIRSIDQRFVIQPRRLLRTVRLWIKGPPKAYTQIKSRIKRYWGWQMLPTTNIPGRWKATEICPHCLSINKPEVEEAECWRLRTLTNRQRQNRWWQELCKSTNWCLERGL